MPCHSDRVRRNYITPAVSDMIRDPQRMCSMVAIEFTEMQIMEVARSPRAWHDLARMSADRVYHKLLADLKARAARKRIL